MNAEDFEERLLRELRRHVEERSGEAAALGKSGRRAMHARRSPRGMALGGIGVASAIAAVVTVANIAPIGSLAAKSPSATVSAAGPLFQMHNAAFAIDAEPSGVVDITILEGSVEPDIDALRSALAKAGVHAEVVTNVPTCEQLAKSPAGPSPIDSAQARVVIDSADHPFFKGGDLGYSVDTSARTRGTTLWIMFSSTLSTIFLERTPDTGRRLNCLSGGVGE